MKMRYPYLWLFLCLCPFFLSCSSGSVAGREEALKAVTQYNSMMKRAYMEANVNLLFGVATQNQIKKLFPVIQALQATQNMMMADQKTFIVKGVSVHGDKAEVKTEEEWVYWWQNKDSAQITKPEEKITYKIRYDLIKQDGAWKVDRIEDVG